VWYHFETLDFGIEGGFVLDRKGNVGFSVIPLARIPSASPKAV
jgi:hypothetical protein